MTFIAALMMLINSLLAYTACYAKEMQIPYGIAIEFAALEEPYVAYTAVNSNYLVAQITYDLDVLLASPDSVIRTTVVHELAHILTWDLGMLADKADPERAFRLFEQLATRIERWPLWHTLCQEV